ncbi:hypothetical protein CK203_095326 [Vitis vinifera]|uniref:DUF4283 domain-containing protein n=1 Tax=Vitis vinifera TaxID=29760 RepID=A0A438E6P9_VITVI|nr:hypothetical protein CK203_095326 [Vitis vinifera]
MEKKAGTRVGAGSQRASSSQGVRRRSFGVESKIFELGPASLGPLMEGLTFCIKDTKNGHWEKSWQENGRAFSLTRGENKGGCFLRLGVTDREKKRFNILWSEESASEGEVLEPHVGKILRGRGETEAQLRGGGAGVKDLRSWGTQMSKWWGLKGNLGLAKLEDGKALLEFELRAEAEKALKNGAISISGCDVRLEKWSQRTGCVMEEEKKREAWVRILGLPIFLWDRDTLCKIGEGCGEFLDIDAKTVRMEELQWARIRVRIKEDRIPSTVDIWVENTCYSVALWWEIRPTLRKLQAADKGRNLAAAGEGAGEFQPREGKRVMEEEGAQGSRLRSRWWMGCGG